MVRVFAAMRDGLEIRTRTDTSWSETDIVPRENIECVAVAADRPRIFLGTFDSGLLRSVDGGASFDPVGEATIGPDAVMCLAFDPSNPDHILVGTEPSRLYRSTDGGTSWVEIPGMTSVPSAPEWSFPPRPDTHHVRWVAISPGDPERWYVGIEAGALLVTPDAGDTWIDRPTGSRRDNHWIVTHESAPDRVYAAAGDGYAESHDQGNSWHHPQEGLDHRYVWSVAVDRNDPETRLVSAAQGPRQAHDAETGRAFVYRRRGQQPWERLDAFPHGSGVTRAVLSPGLTAGGFYGVTNRGIYHSEDGGDTWSAVPGGWPERYATQAARDIAVVANPR